MRKYFDSQMNIDEVNVADIEFDIRSRDAIPKLLKGLQHIYLNRSLRNQVLACLEKVIPQDTDINVGRPGMTLWRILVLGTVRLGDNRDFDSVHELANQHMTLRHMMLHGRDDTFRYNRQTVIDNLTLFTPEILDEINQIVVAAGHELIKKNTLRRILNGTL
jgi:hypothetical protein